YGALEGLVSRTAALRLPGRPARYRATDPAALIAQLAAEQGEALDRLSRSLRDADRAGPESRTVTGERAAANLLMQVLARAGREAAVGRQGCGGAIQPWPRWLAPGSGASRGAPFCPCRPAPLRRRRVPGPRPAGSPAIPCRDPVHGPLPPRRWNEDPLPRRGA